MRIDGSFSSATATPPHRELPLPLPGRKPLYTLLQTGSFLHISVVHRPSDRYNCTSSQRATSRAALCTVRCACSSSIFSVGDTIRSEVRVTRHDFALRDQRPPAAIRATTATTAATATSTTSPASAATHAPLAAVVATLRQHLQSVGEGQVSSASRARRPTRVAGLVARGSGG
jgi:hypothetical protein